MAYNVGYVDAGGYNLGYTGAFTGGPSISAADDATEAQVATVTLANNGAAPTELRLGGTVVSFTFDAGVLTYTAPLLPRNPELTLEVDVDGVTISTTIAYTNTYDMTHTPAIVDDNSIIPESSFGTTQLVELKVVTDADPLVLTVDWAGYDADNFESAASAFVTAVSEVAASTDVVIGYHITETGATGTFTRTLSVADADTTDTTPTAFTFNDLTNQVRSTVVESNTITVLGVDAATDISVSIVGGEYAVDTGSGFGGWTSASTNVQLNYQIKVRTTTSASDVTGATATLTVGGVSDTFTATTGDFTAPMITLTGANPLTITQGATFTDPGATATDAVDGSVAVNQSGTVDANTPANYTRTYTATDAAGNVATATRTVIVEETPDTTAPVVTAPANTTLQFPFGFAGLGQASSNLQAWLNSATALDDRDGVTTVTNNIASQVNPLTAGNYTVTFTSVDAAGNSGTDTAVLTVEMASEPVASVSDVWNMGRAKVKARKSVKAHKKISAFKL